MWREAKSEFKPAHWQYARIRPALVAAGRVIGTDLAERRNFILRNSAPDAGLATTRTLIGAYQSILPGERARAHRHAPHALRVILESRGSYSIVNGRKHPMETGDIVLTPGGCWHGHGHEGTEQAFWFDCLDIPLVHLLEPMSVEEHPEGWESDVIEEVDSSMRFSWQETKLMLQKRAAEPGLTDADLFGTTIELQAPSMPTIGIKVHEISKNWTGKAYRHNASSILVALSGSGQTSISNQTYNWNQGDVMAVPMGNRVMHATNEGAVLVELTDEKLMRYCGFYKLEIFD
ncbi:cupin domain-containing protein [Polaromonas sp. P1(28)-8]|nr:cupin domain-containing protein [Polaromonas sp. P1(28)-8]